MKRVSLVLTILMALALAASAGSISGKVSGVSGKSVVYVDTIAGKTFPAPTQHPVMDQKGLLFSPHILVVEEGTTVDFLNSDNVQHNVFWPSIGGDKKAGHNLGTWPKGEKKSFQFNDVGVASLLCNVHPEMNGYIVVSPTPYFAVTDKSGNYEIKNVPPGKYTLKTWSEDGKVTTQAVEVGAGGATADLTVKK